MRLRRYVIPLAAVMLVAAASLAFAQQVPQPVTTPEPFPPGGAIPTIDPLLQPFLTPVTGVQPFATPAVGTPAAAPTPGLSIEQAEAVPVLIAARSDLELLAAEALGGERPVGWGGSFDQNNPELAILIRLDLEILAGEVFGADERPDDWFGVVASKPLLIARDIRHDLELLADEVMESAQIRPNGWVGDDPIMRCNRATQALVSLLQRQGVIVPVDPATPDFCREIEIEASVLVETEVVQPAVLQPAASAPLTSGGPTGPFQAETEFVVAFYDTFANRRAGALPLGTSFTPQSRSANDLSNMMVISGDGFQVFVDYTTTTVTTEQFEALPEITEGATPPTSCTASWCD